MTKHLSKPASREHLPRPIAVTIGDPAGIGPEICLALANSEWFSRVVLIGDLATLKRTAESLGIDAALSAGEQRNGLRVIDVPAEVPPQAGRAEPQNAAAILGSIERAANGCVDGEFSAMVTAPVNKASIIDAGYRFSGHTEFIAELTDTERSVMLLAADDLRVALVTTHLPLAKVSASITVKDVEQTIAILHRDLSARFGIADPEIIVCGLNPHAGEGGHLGSEDGEIIQPAIEAAASKGIRVRGPLPADTAFTPAAGKADAVVAMYHDQGLPVVKYAGFGNVVNVTLGLPIIRTSVDHGTAFDIAGSGRADAGSLVRAVALAAELADK